MEETHFEDKCPILKCSICNFEVKSVPSMENHVSAVHGVKLKLEIIDSNNTKTPVPEVAQIKSGKTLSQINDLGALTTENQSAKSNHPVSGNAKNEKSIGLLRSFRMNKQDDDIQKSSRKLEKESDIMKNDIERKEKTLEEIMFPNFDEEENVNLDIPRPEMNTVQLHRTQGTVSNENVTNANQNSNPVFTMQTSETIEVSNSSNVTKKLHLCTVCEASFDIKEELTIHIGIKHDHVRPYFCKLCDKGFQRKFDFKRHKGTKGHQEMEKKVAAAGGDIDNDETSQNEISQHENVTNANQTGKDTHTGKFLIIFYFETKNPFSNC